MKAHFIFPSRSSRNRHIGCLQMLLAIGFVLVFVTAGTTFASGSYAEQIQSQRLFSSPLEWTGSQEPGDAEFQALSADIGLFKTNGVKAGLSGLENFLKTYPQSGWAPALNINLAEYYRGHGRYSPALAHWELAWNATKDGRDNITQALAVRAIAGWSRLLASLGKKDDLNALFKEFDGLQLPLGIYGTEIEETREGLGVMNGRPGVSYRCGSYALGHMAAALHLDAQLCRKLYEMDSPDGGFHMDQLLALARTNGMDVEAVRRPVGAELVVPCVVHWKLNHYAAITEEKGGLYRVEDPTFGGYAWLDADTIEAEASGEFILPKDRVPASWPELTEVECANIYGKGYPNLFDDSDDDGPPDGCPPDGDNDSGDSDCDPPAANDGASHGGTPPPPPCPDCGMPQWSVSEPYMTLWIKDTPLLYRQSNGKWMKLTLSYKSRGEVLGNYISSFGPDWSCNWIGMLQSDGSDVVSNHLAGGGVAGFKTDGTLDYKTGRSLTATGGASAGDGGPAMALQSPTGSQNTYGVSQVVYGLATTTNIFLTQRTDRYGRVLQRMDYEAGGGIAILDDVVDMDGHTNILGGAYTITSVTNPYGFGARFRYTLGTPGGPIYPLLTNIVDAQGMSTSFKYDSSDQITNMITPYGTNSFQYFSTNDLSGNAERALLVTEPTGDHQLYVYLDYAPDSIPYPSDPAYSNVRLSFHWNRSQYQAISNNWATYGFAMDATNYQMSSVKHWLHKTLGGSDAVSDTMDSMADPYDPILGIRPNCITYHYYGESSPFISDGSDPALKRVTSVTINGNSQPALVIGRNTLGRPTNFVYNSSSGSAASYTNFFDPGGELLQAERGPRGELTRGYGYGNATITNLLTSVTNAVGDVLRYTHDTNTLKVTSITFPGGLVRTNIYYDCGPNLGFLAMQADLGFRTNYFDYTNGNLCIQTNELGLETDYIYDNLNRLISTAYPDGTTISNVYDKLDIVATKDRLNQWTYFGYNRVRQLMAVTNVNGQVTTYDYCGCGAPDQITRYDGSTPLATLFGYDSIGRLTSASYPDGYQLDYAYDTNDRVQSVTDSGGHELDLNYALVGLESKITNAILGGQTLSAQAFDEYGRVTNNVDRNLVKTVMGYDFLDRLTSRQNFGADGSHSGAESFVYNALGLTNYTDPLSHLTTFVRDASGRVAYETNGNKEVLQFTYNPSDELLTLTDGKNQATTWDYDEYGRVIDKVDAVTTTDFIYQYDPLDRLTNRWSAAKGTTVYRYDPIGNLTNVDYSGGTVLTPSINYSYDSLNRLVKMVDGIGTTAFGWVDGDVDGIELLSEDGPWANDTVGYTYNNSRQRAGLSLLQPSASPWTQSYGYDSVMRLSTVTSPAGGTFASPSGTFTYSYSGGGDRVQQLQFPGSGYVQNYYDSLARLTNTYLSSPLLGTIDQHKYAYDPGSEVTQQVFTAGNLISYGYDAIGQLTAAKGKETGGVINRLQEQFGYAYDAAWNLNYRTNNAVLQTFTVNTLNELTNTSLGGTKPVIAGATTSPATNVTVNGVAATLYGDSTFATTNVTLSSGNNTLTAVAKDNYGRVSSSAISVNLTTTGNFTYDSNGNLLGDGTRNFAYDDENQLVSAWVSGTWSNSFAYDGLARKRIERDYSWNGSSWTQTNEVHFVYDGNLVLQERDGNNLPLTTYTRGNDMSGGLQGAGGIGGLLARSDRLSVVPVILSAANPNPQNVSTSFYHSDGNGNVTALMQPNGFLVASYEYDPFGNMISMSGMLAGANHYRFSSKEWNDNAGLYYYGRRFYDPNLQRWLNRDPIQENGGQNLYRFVKNKPLELIDPMGLICPGQIVDGIAELASIPVIVVTTLSGEIPTFGTDTAFGLMGISWALINGPIDIIGGFANTPNPLPSNPGASFGSLFGDWGENLGGVAWDLVNVKSDLGALASGEHLGLNTMQTGLDVAETGSDISEDNQGNGAGFGVSNTSFGNISPSISPSPGAPNFLPSPPPFQLPPTMSVPCY